MSKGLKALGTIKNAPTIYAGCASDIYTRYPFECKQIEKELKALQVIFKYITIGNPFGNVHYIYLNDESEMIMPEDFEVIKEVMP